MEKKERSTVNQRLTVLQRSLFYAVQSDIKGFTTVFLYVCCYALSSVCNSAMICGIVYVPDKYWFRSAWRIRASNFPLLFKL